MSDSDRPILDGRTLSDADLAFIREQLEEMDAISGISDEMLRLISRLWPDQLLKIRPPENGG